MPPAMTAVPEFKTLRHISTYGRGRIYDDITETIANTPLVRLSKIKAREHTRADILLKLEFFNPLSSVKDRIGVAMIDALEAEGRIKPGVTTLIEPTSGNTGVALAFVAAARGYRLILTMPETMSLERRKILTHLGAELVLTPAAGGMGVAIAEADRLLSTVPNAVQPSQFVNPANPAVHEQTTAMEIWNDTGGRIDALVSAVGTGGTITGCGRALKRLNPALQVFAVEPTTSQVLAGQEKGPHKIQGIGAGFIPANYDASIVDHIIPISSDVAFETSRMLAKVEGIPGGISTGANLAAAIQVARRDDMAGKTIVTFACSGAERYFSSDLFLDPAAPKS